jgi:hypothetical protein
MLRLQFILTYAELINSQDIGTDSAHKYQCSVQAHKYSIVLRVQYPNLGRAHKYSDMGTGSAHKYQYSVQAHKYSGAAFTIS